jgi:hypothetical protein
MVGRTRHIGQGHVYGSSGAYWNARATACMFWLSWERRLCRRNSRRATCLAPTGPPSQSAAFDSPAQGRSRPDKEAKDQEDAPAIVNAYALYIRGRQAGVPKGKLDAMIARWVFGSLLTARYSRSSETIFEEDLARVARLGADGADGFVRALDDAMSETITGDYWTQTLVSALETQKAKAPSALAFRAAQVVLGARALFSDHLLQNLLDPPTDGGRAASEAGRNLQKILRLL